MIEIVDGYVIDVSELSYTLKRDTGNKDKHGKTVYKTYGYYNTLRSALMACIGSMQKETLASNSFTLTEALKAYNETTERFNHLLELAIKEVEK